MKPGRSTLFARFLLDDREIGEIRRLLESSPSVDRFYGVDLTDAAGVVHAGIEKTIYIRRNAGPGR